MSQVRSPWGRLTSSVATSDTIWPARVEVFLLAVVLSILTVCLVIDVAQGGTDGKAPVLAVAFAATTLTWIGYWHMCQRRFNRRLTHNQQRALCKIEYLVERSRQQDEIIAGLQAQLRGGRPDSRAYLRPVN